MTTYTKSGSFGWAGGGKGGAVVDLWAASRFSGPPAENDAPPAGNPDAGPVTTGVNFGNPGAYVISGIPTVEDYYVRVQYGGNTYWGAAPASTLGGTSPGTVDTIVAGTGITVDNTDPANPIVSASGATPTPTVSLVLTDLSPSIVNHESVTPLVPNTGGGPWGAGAGLSVCHPHITYAAGGIPWNAFVYNNNLTAFTIEYAQLEVFDQAGTNRALLEMNTPISVAAGTSTQLITWPTNSGITGTDLTYSSSAPYLSTTAGGLYAINCLAGISSA